MATAAAEPRGGKPAALGAGTARLIRLPEWWSFKLPPLLAVAYLLLAGPPAVPPAPAAVTLALFLASAFATAAWGHLLNDLADREADRRSGRPRPVARLSPGLTQALLAALLGAALVPWWLLPASALARTCFAAELALLAAYSLPPVRLKERGFAGVLADALYGHALPMGITVGIFGALQALSAPGPVSDAAPVGAAVAATLVGWKLLQGLCGALASQIADRRADRRAGTRTFVLGHGALASQRLLLRALLPLQLTCFLAALALLTPRAPWLLPAYALFLAVRLFQIHRRWGHGLSFYRRRYPGYALLNDFHERWLPLGALAQLALADPRYLALAVAHLLLFRSGLHDLFRALWERGGR